MDKHIEKEFKILVEKDTFEKLCNSYSPLYFVKQVNTYYDTIHKDIAMHKGAMRIREKNGKFIFTLKMIQYELDGLHECECEVSENSVEVFKNAEIQELLKEYGIQGAIVPIATLTTQRAVIDLEFAELCFDISSYGNKTDYEIEYEYKAPHDGLTTFQNILSQVGLVYEKNCISKIQRAMKELSL